MATHETPVVCHDETDTEREVVEAVRRFREPVWLHRAPDGGLAVRVAAEGVPGGDGAPTLPPGERVGWLPPLFPEWLGDRSFQADHGVRFAYVMGSMANGVATPRLVVEAAGAALLGFFGAAGLSFERVEAGLDQIARGLDGRSLAWGVNLIHSPHEPSLEDRLVDLFIRRGVRNVEASAYLDLTPAVVRFAGAGLRVGPGGEILRRGRLFAKVSRLEVARRFMRPAPGEILADLVGRGQLTADEARLAARVPLATDVTVEADSAGHTDNRPLTVLLPAVMQLRDEIEWSLGLARAIRVGAGGGLGTPAAVAAAFALGAAYVLTGSVNQSAVESGLSADGKAMLAAADMTDVAMAAAADMFELGVRLQVLKRGTLFATRANKLYEIYRSYDGLEALPDELRAELESRIFGESLEHVWRETEAYWSARDPSQVARAQADARHRMALAFRWYLGKASRWAIAGERSRRADYQIWCGPAMGAFNGWVKGSFLEDPARRTVVQIALNLLEGAAVVTRAQQLRSMGVAVPAEAFFFRPRPLRL